MEFAPQVLCVDDEPVNLMLLEALLEPVGYTVLTAADGREAQEILQGRKVDLILLDVMMPGTNGFDTCKAIKGSPHGRHIPVILLTALSAREDRIRGIEAGADDFISKPFDRGEVLARVKMLLEVKSLNERLSGAYGTIVGLFDTACKLIRAFDAQHFEFKRSVEAFLALVLRRRPEEWDRPETALVGFPKGPGAWSWREYRVEGEAMAASRIFLEVEGAEGEAKLLFFNEEDLREPKGASLLRALEPLETKARNLVCYLGDHLAIFLVNYGKRVSAYDAAVLQGLVTQSLFLRSLAAQVNETEQAFAYTVGALARAAEANDVDTGNHIQRVGEYCAALALHLGAPEGFVRDIRLQAQMHDVGKIHIHPDLLRKTGDLSEEEWAAMQKHTLYGAKILGDHPRLRMAKNVALSHHEKWDGSGYPFGLKGEAIPLEGRIVGIADQYDALRSKRLYKPAFDHDATCKILLEGEGRTAPGHFDPRVLDAFKANAELFAGIYEGVSG